MRAALVVAAHGDGDGSPSNRWVTELAQRAAKALEAPEWGVAFHKGTPSFANAFQHIKNQQVVVVPLLTSQGYYYQRLQQQLPSQPKHWQLSAPVGTSEKLPHRVTRRVEQLIQQNCWSAHELSVVVIGHGTRRNPLSRQASEQLTTALKVNPWLEVHSAYLDEDPGPETIALKGRHRLYLPFLIGPGGHAERDLPARLAHSNGYLDRPIGLDPTFAELIADRALQVQGVTA